MYSWVDSSWFIFCLWLGGDSVTCFTGFNHPGPFQCPLCSVHIHDILNLFCSLRQFNQGPVRRLAPWFAWRSKISISWTTVCQWQNIPVHTLFRVLHAHFQKRYPPLHHLWTELWRMPQIYGEVNALFNSLRHLIKTFCILAIRTVSYHLSC